MMQTFGMLNDGRRIEAISLGHTDGLQAEVLTYGGILRSLTVPTRHGHRNVVLSLPTLADYVLDPAYLSVLVGRFGNRIAKGQFELDGNSHQLNVNNGPNHLHGGIVGFGKRVWRVLNVEGGARHTLTLGLRSPAGEEGYPGTLDVIAELVVDTEELHLRFEAQCDEATPVNLTYHPYFNLSGEASRTANEHQLRIAASSYLPVQDSQLIPTGEIASVTNTPFDFKTWRNLWASELSSHSQLVYGGGYDHCWVLDAERDYDAELYSPYSGIAMKLRSDQCGLQFYSGQSLPNSYPGVYGICLEPQRFPNAVNQPNFHSAILRPGQTYCAELRYLFSAD